MFCEPKGLRVQYQIFGKAFECFQNKIRFPKYQSGRQFRPLKKYYTPIVKRIHIYFELFSLKRKKN